MAEEISPSLLSGYLDGELTSDERRRVDSLLKRDPAAAKLLHSLRRISETLSQLPRIPASDIEVARTFEDLRQVAPGRDAVETYAAGDFLQDFIFRPEWIVAAYLDGELSNAQARFVRGRLLGRPGAAAFLKQLERQKQWVSELPRIASPAGLVDATTTLFCPSIPEEDGLVLDAAIADPFGKCLESLPREVAPADLWETVRRRLTNDSSPVAELPRPLETPVRRPADRSRHLWAWPAVAASLLAAWLSMPGRQRHDDDVESKSNAVVATTSPTAPSPMNYEDDKASPAASAPAATSATNSLAASSQGAKPAVAVASAATLKGSGKSGSDAAPPSRPPVIGDALVGLKPGDLVALESPEVQFVCLDVEKVYDRLRYVLIDHQASFRSLDSEAKDRSEMYVVEVTTTQEQLGEILSDLNHTENVAALIAETISRRRTPIASVAKVAEKTPQETTTPLIKAPDPRLASVIPSRSPAVRPAKPILKVEPGKSVKPVEVPLSPGELAAKAAESKALAKKAVSPPVAVQAVATGRPREIKIVFILSPFS